MSREKNIADIWDTLIKSREFLRELRPQDRQNAQSLDLKTKEFWIRQKKDSKLKYAGKRKKNLVCRSLSKSLPDLCLHPIFSLEPRIDCRPHCINVSKQATIEAINNSIDLVIQRNTKMELKWDTDVWITLSWEEPDVLKVSWNLPVMKPDQEIIMSAPENLDEFRLTDCFSWMLEIIYISPYSPQVFVGGRQLEIQPFIPVSEIGRGVDKSLLEHEPSERWWKHYMSSLDKSSTPSLSRTKFESIAK